METRVVVDTSFHTSFIFLISRLSQKHANYKTNTNNIYANYNAKHFVEKKNQTIYQCGGGGARVFIYFCDFLPFYFHDRIVMGLDSRLYSFIFPNQILITYTNNERMTSDIAFKTHRPTFQIQI